MAAAAQTEKRSPATLQASRMRCFLRAQLLELIFQHLLQRLGYTRVNVLRGAVRTHFPPFLHNRTSFRNVPHNARHEQSVPTGVVVNQLRKT